MQAGTKLQLLLGATALTWSAAIWTFLDPGNHRPQSVIVPYGSHIPGPANCREGHTLGPEAKAECEKAIVEFGMSRAALIQQVRAANAAEAANRLMLSQGRLALLQTIVGLFTLIAAAAAAIFAGKAAREAHRGSDAAERNVETFERASRLQMTAYVGLKDYSRTYRVDRVSNTRPNFTLAISGRPRHYLR
jgi:hypothetical protein